MNGQNTPDFSVNNCGSIFLLNPRTQSAKDWVADNIGDEATRYCGGIVVEHRYIDAIVAGILNDGLEVEE